MQANAGESNGSSGEQYREECKERNENAELLTGIGVRYHHPMLASASASALPLRHARMNASATAAPARATAAKSRMSRVTMEPTPLRVICCIA